MTLDKLEKSTNGLSENFLRLLKATGLSVLFGFSSQAYALEFQCEVTGDVRFLRVEIPGKERLCEVSVNYKNTGERRVMWYADNDTLFCSAKIYALKDKYEQTWNFKCEPWPDLDGIDLLSPSNRQILDTQLKQLIEQGKNSNPGFTVNHVKAVASNLFDNQAGTLALQFFLSSGDVTQVIIDDGESWEVFSSIDNMASHISSDLPISTALISAISDSGTLEIETTIASDSAQNCFGQQAFGTVADNELTPQSEHRYICDKPIVAAQKTGQ